MVPSGGVLSRLPAPQIGLIGGERGVVVVNIQYAAKSRIVSVISAGNPKRVVGRVRTDRTEVLLGWVGARDLYSNSISIFMLLDENWLI